jgi:D-glycero-alpha-D-manno-heptose-7-phosphate kinase
MKRQLAKTITTSLINNMVEKAIANGATGCKIAGAGGGGFLMSYVPIDKQEIYRNAMSDFQELSYQFDPIGTRILLNVQSGII